MKLTFKQFSSYVNLPPNMSDKELDEAIFGLFKTADEKEQDAKALIAKASAAKAARDKILKDLADKRAKLAADAEARKAAILAKKRSTGGPQSGSAAAARLADREFALGEHRKIKNKRPV